MRVLITTPVLPPELGGPATFVPRLASFLVDHGHAVSVLSYVDDPARAASQDFPVSLVKRRAHPVRWVTFFLRCVRLAARADLVLVCEHPARLSVVAARLFRRRLVLRVMVNPAWELCYRFGLTREDPERFASARHGWKVRLIERLQELSIRRADLVLAVSRHLAVTAARLGAAPERIVVSYNLPPAHEGPGVDRSKARQRLELEPSAFVLLVVSRLVNWKGVDTVLAALAELPEGFRLVVMGDGPAATELRDLASRLGVAHRVFFAGGVDGGRVALAMRAADALVLNSLYEGLSHVVLEAMAAGLPVLASDVPGNRELIEHEHNGLLFPCGDREKLKSEVQRLADRPELREQLARRGQERAREIRAEHSLDRLVARFEALVPSRAEAVHR